MPVTIEWRARQENGADSADGGAIGQGSRKWRAIFPAAAQFAPNGRPVPRWFYCFLAGQNISPSDTRLPGVLRSTGENKMKKLLDERETAFLLEMSVSWLRNGRAVGTGPAYVRIGRSIRYRPEDITDWLNSQFSGGK
ncbi:helix-turn-helix transcriptional regulator [Citrifermentans bremense]|uniref:helix-turn-helix transcriptional regulator n=1 Tax=Citrifermentans bremense TaxID=60035 RepID=UPI0018DBABE5|nr:helix-turn-helix domain-containing protein [Citrifermentans bremense]